MTCESLWLITRRPTEVRAVDLIRAALVACDPSRVRIVEEFSGGSTRVFVEVVSGGECSQYLSPLLRYILGEDARIVPSECGDVPLGYASAAPAAPR